MTIKDINSTIHDDWSADYLDFLKTIESTMELTMALDQFS